MQWRLLSLLLLGAAFIRSDDSSLSHEDGIVEDADYVDDTPHDDLTPPDVIPSTPSYEQDVWRSSFAPYCGPAQSPPTESDVRFMLIVGKMDGELVGLDAGNGGREVWRINTDADAPLLSSTLSDVELLSNDEVFRLIPSLDGNLYMYQSSGVMQAIPVSGDSLMSSTLRFGQDVVAGGRTVSTHGINVLTGQLHYSCSLSECDRSDIDPAQIRNNLVVKRVSQTVRALDPSTGFEKWNVSVGELELMLSRGRTDWAGHSDASFCQRDDYQDQSDFWRRMADIRFVMNPPTGYIAAVSISAPSHIYWETYLQVPIAQAWELREWGLGPLSLFDPHVVPSLDAIRLDIMLDMDRLFVKQSVEVMEVLTGYESANKYEILNGQGRRVYVAYEQSGCCTRCCCGPERCFDMAVVDGVGVEVMHFRRPLRKTCCWGCCCPQEILVSVPRGNPVGRVVQRPCGCGCGAAGGHNFLVLNSRDVPILLISGPCCICDVVDSFEVKSWDGRHSLGRISKRWSGLAKELFTDADNFGITFPLDLALEAKATLLAATILIDFLFFETVGNKKGVKQGITH